MSHSEPTEQGRPRATALRTSRYATSFTAQKQRQCHSGQGPYKRKDITAGIEMIDRWKVISSRSGHEHAGNPGTDGTRRVLARIDVLPPGTVCTETYLVIGHYATEKEARNLLLYMKTRFFRFLMALFMYSHGITKDTFAYIPILDMTRRWTDADLAERYKLAPDEVAFIESKIRAWE
jgi:site-specific DNA-methyltransferase (adenine-specific)